MIIFVQVSWVISIDFSNSNQWRPNVMTNVCLQDEVRSMVNDYNPVKVSLQMKEDRTYVSCPRALPAGTQDKSLIIPLNLQQQFSRYLDFYAISSGQFHLI